MTPQQSSDLASKLEANRGEVHAVVQGLSDAQAQQVPGEGRWSVIGCVEHIIIVEKHFLGLAQHPAADPAPERNPEKEAHLAAVVVARETRVQAPPFIHPTGSFSTLSDALAAFDATRRETIAFAREQGENLYNLCAMHPFFGPLNGVEMMELIGAHATRHGKQIEEVRAAL